MAAGLALATRKVRATKVGGVQTLWAPGDGLAVARLQFRVGQADERLPMRGITHLVEHLAFERLGQPTYSHNGSVSMDTTSFDVAGTQEEIAEFFRVITRGLQDPPVERLAAERHLLKVESQRRGGVFEEMASIRHGAQGNGLSAYLELGLEHLDAADLRAWARSWFTADNAVLWLWGADPTALELDLPRGERMPLPPVPLRPLPPRSWFNWGDSGAALTFLTETDRGTANAASWWLQRYLTRSLRHEAGLAYAVTVQQRPLGDRRLFSVAVDGSPDRSLDLRVALFNSLEALETAAVAEDEIAAWQRETNEFVESTERQAELGRLDLAASGLLLTGVVTRPEEVAAQCAAVTAEGVAAAVRGWYETCLLAMPNGVDMPPEWKVVQRSSATSITGGKVYAPGIRALQGQRLLVSPKGVTLEVSAEVRWTVRWDDCAAVLRHADGSLTPIGHDGVSMQLLPGDWVGDEQLFSELARQIDPSLVVPMENKPTDRVVKGLSGLAAVSSWLLTPLILVLWISTIAVGSLLGDPEANAATVAFFTVLAALSAGATWALVVRLRAPAERRRLPRESMRDSKLFHGWMVRQSETTLAGLEAGAWTLVAMMAMLVIHTGGPYYVPVLIAFGALRIRRERNRVAARRADAVA